jgi:hypothetical protein
VAITVFVVLSAVEELHNNPDRRTVLASKRKPVFNVLLTPLSDFLELHAFASYDQPGKTSAM